MISHLPNCACHRLKGLAYLVASLHCHSERERRMVAMQVAQRDAEVAQLRKNIHDKFARFTSGVLADQQRANAQGS